MVLSPLTQAVLARKLAGSCRKAYASGQGSADSDLDPEGLLGHAAGLEGVWLFLVESTDLGDLVDARAVETLISEIGA
jgi:hypothetical protein